MRKGILLFLLALYCSDLMGQINSNVSLFTGNSFLTDANKRKALLIVESKDELFETLDNSALFNSHHSNTIIETLLNIYRIDSAPLEWVSPTQTKPIFEEAYRQVKESYLHGLEPERYGLSYMEQIMARLNQSMLTRAEYRQININVTANYLLFNYDLIRGRINPEDLSGYWVKDKRQVKLLKRLTSAFSPKRLRSHLKKITPSSKQYIQLQKAYSYYRNMAGMYDWYKLELVDTKVIEPLDTNKIIPEVRRRLTLLHPEYTVVAGGVIPGFMDSDTAVYDIRLQEKIEDFQKLHGLEPDGKIGKATLRALNLSPERKAAIIALNLERMRWQPSNMGKHFIHVNIPEYKLRVYDGKRETLSMRVIVGSEYTSTPVFSDTLKYLVMSPTWTVPVSIKVKEMLPRLIKEPDYYTKKNYKFYKGWSYTDEVNPQEVDWKFYHGKKFPFNAVQQPGPSNALGRVKFIMPNDMSIYLHDTPGHHLFQNTERALSHGCIRLEKPRELANYLLRDQKEWTDHKIWQSMNQSEPKRVDLKKEYHVQLAYFTAFIDAYGQLNFRDDIYGHDDEQLRLLQTIL